MYCTSVTSEILVNQRRSHFRDRNYRKSQAEGVKPEFGGCVVRSAPCIQNVWESPLQEGAYVPKWIRWGCLWGQRVPTQLAGGSRAAHGLRSHQRCPGRFTAGTSWRWRARRTREAGETRPWRLSSAGFVWPPAGAEPALGEEQDRALPLGWGDESLALCWTSNTTFCVVSVLAIPFLLPGSHIVEHHKMPSYFTATGHSQLGNTFSSQKRRFPPQLKSTFMVSGEAMRPGVAAKANRSQRIVLSGFLLYWREKRRQIRGSQQRRGPGRTRQPTCSVHTRPPCRRAQWRRSAGAVITGYDKFHIVGLI